jgi:hypothetical protein
MEQQHQQRTTRTCQQIAVQQALQQRQQQETGRFRAVRSLPVPLVLQMQRG